jgi:hypothetical protein
MGSSFIRTGFGKRAGAPPPKPGDRVLPRRSKITQLSTLTSSSSRRCRRAHRVRSDDPWSRLLVSWSGPANPCWGRSTPAAAADLVVVPEGAHDTPPSRAAAPIRTGFIKQLTQRRVKRFRSTVRRERPIDQVVENFALPSGASCRARLGATARRCRLLLADRSHPGGGDHKLYPSGGPDAAR